MDVIHKCSTAGVNKHGIRLNMLRKEKRKKIKKKGPVKGRLLGPCGVGLVSNSQSLEACWRWDLHMHAREAW